MVDRRRWEELRKARLPRPHSVPQTVWSKMNYLQRYNLSNGLLIWDRRTKRCKRSRLAETQGRMPDIPSDLEYVPSVSDPKKIVLVPKRLQKKKKKKKTTKKKLSTHHRSIDPLIMVTGSGSFTLSDRSTYVGEMKKGVLHGNGVRSWKDGSTYTGGWLNGTRNGQGSMVYPTGEEYIGLWKNDTKTGRGTMFRKNGSMFVADWENNLVLKPYTKKSSNEQAYDVYKMYLKLGTYQKVADELNIDKDRVQELVRRYRELRKSTEVKKPKRKKAIGPKLFKTSERNVFINTSSIEKLDLKLKTIQILKRNGIVTLRDLTRTSGIEILRIHGLGNSIFKDIESSLKEFGLRLRSSTVPTQNQKVLRRRKKLRALDNYGIYMSKRYS